MIKSVVHLNNKGGFIVHYETDKKAFTKSFCENKVPKSVIDFMNKKDCIQCENSKFYK